MSCTIVTSLMVIVVLIFVLVIVTSVVVNTISESWTIVATVVIIVYPNIITPTAAVAPVVIAPIIVAPVIITPIVITPVVESPATTVKVVYAIVVKSSVWIIESTTIPIVSSVPSSPSSVIPRITIDQNCYAWVIGIKIIAAVIISIYIAWIVIIESIIRSMESSDS